MPSRPDWDALAAQCHPRPEGTDSVSEQAARLRAANKLGDFARWLTHGRSGLRDTHSLDALDAAVIADRVLAAALAVNRQLFGSLTLDQICALPNVRRSPRRIRALVSEFRSAVVRGDIKPNASAQHVGRN